MLTKSLLFEKKHIRFVGVGGVSMSALAMYLAQKGIKVSGSDKACGEFVRLVQNKGIFVDLTQSGKGAEDCDLAVINFAVHEDNEEYLFLKSRNVPFVWRNEVLGALFNDFKQSVSVSGSHGKTTVSAWLSWCLKKAGKDPTCFVGGLLNNPRTNLLVGKSDVCVAEACEYKKSFLTLHPFVNCVLNVDSDHPDCYKNFDEISSAFKEFLGHTKKGGVNMLFGDDPVLKNIEGIKFGFEKSNDFYPQNIVDKKGFFEFDAVKKGKKLLRLSLPLAGRHNIANALCVFAAGEFLGLDLESLKEGIESFEGVNRRCSVIKGDFDVIVDYAHHPKEIACFLSTVKEMGYNKLFLVFQPHTYTRTKLLFDDFVKVLDGDEIHIIPTFAAREEVLKGFESSDLAAAAKEKGKNVFYDENLAKLCDCLKKKCKKNDAVLLVGAGDVENLKQYLV